MRCCASPLYSSSSYSQFRYFIARPSRSYVDASRYKFIPEPTNLNDMSLLMLGRGRTIYIMDAKLLKSLRASIAWRPFRGLSFPAGTGFASSYADILLFFTRDVILMGARILNDLNRQVEGAPNELLDRKEAD
jgi:hypothetical protein